MDSFFKSGFLKSKQKLMVLENKHPEKGGGSDDEVVKFVAFRSKRRLEKFVYTLNLCHQAEQKFLENNSHVTSEWWSLSKPIFYQPESTGFYPTGYAKIYYAKFILPRPLFQYRSVQSDRGLEVFFETLYPLLFNRYQLVLPCNPKKYSYFCFNLNRLIFVPGNPRHNYMLKTIENRDLFNLKNV